ncbi:MAG: 16S rRNA (guanine(966)-N(2))-methyltransferase RsmD [Firmicutes bacterium]|jgi:16S rRNA (guanine(966)-N(2))-methyltransferase RsmD|nr:16S rRNA (guanine(966)-N(2))-methyltransferase RsmD [Bacillota bacterium]
MRIIAGSAKGMKLKSIPGRAVRPTGERVREALFSILGSRVIAAVVLDLFAGSGAVGIEALSRGAVSCIFVEQERRHLAVIKENLVRARLLEQARLLAGNVCTALGRLAREGVRADLIFLDPPYSTTLIPALLRQIYRASLLREGGLVIVEHAAANRAWSERYPQKRQKQYGGTCLTFITPEGLAAAEEESGLKGPEEG